MHSLRASCHLLQQLPEQALPKVSGRRSRTLAGKASPGTSSDALCACGLHASPSFGPVGLAEQEGLVDEFQMIVCPAIVGGGKRFFPDGVRLDLELLEERRLDSGVVILRYGVRGAAGGLALGMKSSEILPA